MARRQTWSVGELIVEQGGTIRAGASQRAAKVVRAYKIVPAAKVANRFATTADLANGAITVLNSGTMPDGIPHNISITVTRVDTADTGGTLTIVGTNVNGERITETIAVPDNTKAVGNKAFLTVTSLSISGWAQGGTGADTRVIGFDDKQGLPECVAATGDVILVSFNGVVENAPTLAVDTDEVEKNTITEVGDASKVLSVIYQV